MLPAKVISGGQTGVDRAGLDAAIEAGLQHGGACPAGRRAEDGRIPDRYQLTELDSPGYPARTRRNVHDSDGTLILTAGPPTGGTALTVDHARELGRPCLVVDLNLPEPPEAVSAWIEEHRIRTLNVAGPRESGCPGIGRLARAYLGRILA